jgi:hypothetical protein
MAALPCHRCCAPTAGRLLIQLALRGGHLGQGQVPGTGGETEYDRLIGLQFHFGRHSAHR